MGVTLLLIYLIIFKGNICVQDDTPVAAHLLGWHNTFLETPEFPRNITLLVGGSPKFLGTYTRRFNTGRL
ncbi:hypothetical protein K15_016 [Salmonella phage Kenya-K15]|nr:hypothetical protein K15_016 [Salmonella phage Kenya-K15]